MKIKYRSFARDGVIQLQLTPAQLREIADKLEQDGWMVQCIAEDITNDAFALIQMVQFHAPEITDIRRFEPGKRRD